MTRNQVFAAYNIRDGYICSPGKFEGEPLWAPHMFEAYMAGDGDDMEDDHGGVLLFILEEDREEYPELEDTTAVRIWQDSQGFVRTMEYPFG